MSGLEITALSVIGVVGYVAGMGITYRLVRGKNCERLGVAMWLLSGVGLLVLPMVLDVYWPRKGRHFVTALWPLAAVTWFASNVGRALYLPLAATFRVCAGTAGRR